MEPLQTRFRRTAVFFQGPGQCHRQPAAPGWPLACPCRARPQPIAIASRDPYAARFQYGYYCADDQVQYSSPAINEILTREQKDPAP